MDNFHCDPVEDLVENFLELYWAVWVYPSFRGFCILIKNFFVVDNFVFDGCV